MRVCSYLNLAVACGLVALSFAGCGSKETSPAETPAETASEPSDEGEPTAAASEGESASAEGDSESLLGSEDPAANPGAAKQQAGTPADGEDTRTIEIVRKIVMEHRPTVRKCYEAALKELPGLHGDVVIHFVLDPEGKVKKAELNQDKSTLKSPQVVECAINTIKGIKFPPSSRGMQSEINYPFNFKP